MTTAPESSAFLALVSNFKQRPVVGAPGRHGHVTCCLLPHYCPRFHPHP